VLKLFIRADFSKETKTQSLSDDANYVSRLKKLPSLRILSADLLTVKPPLGRFGMSYLLNAKLNGTIVTTPKYVVNIAANLINKTYGGDCIMLREGNFWTVPCENKNYFACKRIKYCRLLFC